MNPLGTDWRFIDDAATTWFPAPSLSAGAAMVHEMADLGVAIELRSSGIRVRVGGDHGAAEHRLFERTAAVSAAAAGLGLTADAASLQSVNVILESVDPVALHQFWQPLLGYDREADDCLTDPLRRDPRVSFRPATASLPLRNRIHLDVARPGAVVEQLTLGEASGPYGLCHADPDGNEADVVPGDPLGGSASDWQGVFAAMACYRVESAARQAELVRIAASLADDAGFPLLIDLRPGLVILDSGKDQADADAHGLDVDFTELAANIQSAARDLGATADPALPRFVQIVVDAADVSTVRTFWLAALEYLPDGRDHVTDIYDPRRLNPVVVFQELDASEDERRRQRNRIAVELTVPSDQASERIDAALAAGGHVVGEEHGRTRIADPERNELVIVSAG